MLSAARLVEDVRVLVANCQIRQQPHYRREAFERGLRAAGYRLINGGAPSGPEDVLVIWNRYGTNHAIANAWEQRGGTVLVCENGYIGKDANGLQYYAIAAHGHNGSGWWPQGTEDRWALLGIPLAPWVNRPDGYALVCGQRGIGSPTMASPPNWHMTAAAYVGKWHPNVKVRLHPGNKAPATPVEDDLAGAAYCVIWSSSSGVKAMTMGVPVIYDAPSWICADAAIALSRLTIGGPVATDAADGYRLRALQRMAHAQWSVAEIESGEPFARFLAEIATRKAA